MYRPFTEEEAAYLFRTYGAWLVFMSYEDKRKVADHYTSSQKEVTK